MSIATASKSHSPPTDFVSQLLDEQSQLSAVERFSAQHNASLVGEASVENDYTPAQARYYKALLPATSPKAGEQYSFEVDLDACSGCKACVVACHTLNGLDEDESWRSVGTITIGRDLPQIKHVTTACHHCDDPGCLKGCPVKAYVKDPVTGIVKHLDDQCIGCKYCTMMCPYEVPKYSERLGIVRKCDMCSQRLSVGEAPACVQSCPNGAIAIRLVNAEAQVFEEGERLCSAAPVSSITRPTTQYVGVDSLQLTNAIPQDAGVDSVAESHWPLAVMLVATQASVGLLMVERLAAGVTSLAGGTLGVSLTSASVVLALFVAGVGMGIAPLHLGQPLRAWRVFLGLRTSWLSREAVLLGKYMAFLTAAVVLLGSSVWMDWLPARFQLSIPDWTVSVTLALALTFGLVGVFSSGMIYVATRRQLWRFSRTMLRFLGTGGVVGTLGFAAICAVTDNTKLAAFALVSGALFAALKFSWEWRILLGPNGRHATEYDVRSRVVLTQSLAGQKALRLVFGMACPVLACVAGASLMGGFYTVGFAASVLAVIAALAGEMAERLLYFSTVVYDRMPGAMP